MEAAISLRCQAQTGIFQLEDLTLCSTIGDLHQKISQKLNIQQGSFKILCGFPPHALPEDDKLTLASANITSGEKLTIQQLPEMNIKKAVNIKETSNFEEAKNMPKTFHNFLSETSGIMMRHVVPSNNSCLFTSISFLISHGVIDPENSNELRQVIARVISNDSERYNAAFLGMSNTDYCSWIQNLDHWGGAIELSILSDHYNIEIVALDLVNVMMHRFGELKSYPNRIFVIYDGIHYDPLVLELGDGTTQYVFSSKENHYLDMALEVAREANSSRQFTDVNNFTLKCMVCHTHLRGQEEAQNHYKETKHFRFGEI